MKREMCISYTRTQHACLCVNAARVITNLRKRCCCCCCIALQCSPYAFPFFLIRNILYTLRTSDQEPKKKWRARIRPIYINDDDDMMWWSSARCICSILYVAREFIKNGENKKSFFSIACSITFLTYRATTWRWIIMRFRRRRTKQTHRPLLAWWRCTERLCAYPGGP